MDRQWNGDRGIKTVRRSTNGPSFLHCVETNDPVSVGFVRMILAMSIATGHASVAHSSGDSRRPARLFAPLPHRRANSVNDLRPIQLTESQSHLGRTPATSRFFPATVNSRARVRLKRQLSRSTRRMIARAEIVFMWDSLPACRVFSRNRQAGSRSHEK